MAQAQNNRMKRSKDSKFVYMTSLGFNSGVGTLKFKDDTRELDNKIFIFNINQLLAYQFNPYVTSGISLGIDIWKKTAFIPLTANLSIDFMDYFVSPHWYLNAGYAFKWYMTSKPEIMDRVIQGGKPGWHINTGIGAKVKMSNKLALLIAAEYRMQNTTIQYSVTAPQEVDYSLITTNRTQNMFYHFVGIKIGLWYW